MKISRMCASFLFPMVTERAPDVSHCLGQSMHYPSHNHCTHFLFCFGEYTSNSKNSVTPPSSIGAHLRSREGVVRENGCPKGCFWRVRFVLCPLKVQGLLLKHLKPLDFTEKMLLSIFVFGRPFLRTTPSPLLWHTPIQSASAERQQLQPKQTSGATSCLRLCYRASACHSGKGILDVASRVPRDEGRSCCCRPFEGSYSNLYLHKINLEKFLFGVIATISRNQ